MTKIVDAKSLMLNRRNMLRGGLFAGAAETP